MDTEADQVQQPPYASTTLLSKKEQHILDNQMEINWLKRQIEQRKQDHETFAAIKHHVENLSDDQIQEELQYYAQQVEAIRVNMDIMTQFNLSKDRIGINLDDSHFSLKAQYPENVGVDHLHDKQTLQIQDFLMKRDKLVVESMQLLDKLNETQNQLAQLQAQAIEKYQDNQQLWANLEMIKKNLEQLGEQETQILSQSVPAQSQGRTGGSSGSVASSQYTSGRAMDKHRDVLNRLEIAKNVLMGLILESNIDWASDRKWSRVMLLIGTEEDD